MTGCRPPTSSGSTMSRWTSSLLAAVVAAVALPCYALGEKSFVSFEPAAGALELVRAGHAATIYCDEGDFPGVTRAARDLQADVERVSGVKPALMSPREMPAADVVIVGTLGK